MKYLNINDTSLVHFLIGSELAFNAPETIDMELVEKVYLKLLRDVDVKVAVQLSESYIKIRDYFNTVNFVVPPLLHEFFYEKDEISYEQFMLNVQQELTDAATHLDFKTLLKFSQSLLEFEIAMKASGNTNAILCKK